MSRPSDRLASTPLVLAPALLLLWLLALPAFVLSIGVSFEDLSRGVQNPMFWPAVGLSLRSAGVSLLVIALLGTPLAWWMAHSSRRVSRLLGVLVDVPVVLPPAVVGISLLYAFGRSSFIGRLLEGAGFSIAFSTVAVILAQVVVAAPFYVQAATAAFRTVENELLEVATTFGATRFQVFRLVVLPMCLPGLLSGFAMSTARALGEFGATLIFAGNLPGTTQTMPLAVYAALELELAVALSLALTLVVIGVGILLVLRLLGDSRPRQA